MENALLSKSRSEFEIRVENLNKNLSEETKTIQFLRVEKSEMEVAVEELQAFLGKRRFLFYCL